MKRLLLLIVTIVTLIFYYPKTSFGQAPDMGTAADFVLFTSVGAITNTGISHLTGNVGSNSGSSTGFGNVNGGMHDGDLVSGQCMTDLLLLYGDLNTRVATFFPAPLLGNGATLYAGVYNITGATTLNNDLILDGQNDPNALFIFQIQGTFGTGANAKVKLINGAKACNVFWKIEGLVSLAAGTTMRGNIIVNNAGINMNTGDTLEGRALSTNGAIVIDGILAYTPIGCGSPVLTGPLAPTLASVACFTIFSSNGPVANTGVTHIVGDVGTNVGLTTGFNPLFVTGTIHPIPDGSTVQCAADLLNVYNYMNAIPYDINLLYPAQFGQNLVLTPHTYLMNGATTFTDSLYLDGMNDPDAVFVIKIYGALSTSNYSKVILINGTQAKNVYWMVSGAVDINDYSVFNGTIICNNGAINLKTGVTLNGRALSTDGAVATSAITATMPPGCGSTGPIIIITQPILTTSCIGDSASLTVTASGVGLTYQWRKGNVNLVNGGNISGATSDTLTINPITNADTSSFYNVIISSTNAPNDTSDFVSLLFGTAPIITNEPTNQNVCIGNSATFTVIASGNNNTYQWRKGNVILVNGGDISGATNDTLVIDNVSISDTSSLYNVIVYGECSPNDTSNYVSLNINTAPIIISEPSNQAPCLGSTASFIVNATGTDLHYQWRKGNVNLINGGDISGVTTNNLIIDNVSISDTSSFYNVIVTGDCAPNDTSVFVSLIIGFAPVITTEPINQTLCEGSTASFYVIASGTANTYQWRKGNVALVNGGDISGATNDTLIINNVSIADAASNYNVVVIGGCAPNDTSNFVSLIVNSAPIIMTEPTNQTPCLGNTASFIVNASGTNLTYQWRKGNVNLINGGDIAGATNDTLIIDNVSTSDTSSFYNVIISGDCAPNDTSIFVSLLIGSSPIITTEPISQTVCAGSTATFTVIASGTSNTYQWRKGNVALVNGGNIAGATNDTLIITNVSIADAASNYNVVVIGDCAPNDTSNLVSLIVNSAPIITNEPSNIVICQGSSASFIVGASGTNLTYQWRKGNANLINGGDISGATNDTLIIDNVIISDTSSFYNVIVSGDCAPSDTSIYVSLAMATAPIITVEPISKTACSGSLVNFTVTAIGTNVTYQWRIGNMDITNGGSVSGATTSTLTINPVETSDAALNYNVVVSGTCTPNDVSVDVSLTVNQTPVAIANSNSPVCLGDNINLTAQTVTDGTYNWTGPNGFTSTDQNPIIANATVADAGNYNLSISTVFCTSEVVTTSVVVNNCVADLSVVKTADNMSPIVGTSVIFNIVATNNGPANATGVVITDILQSGYTFVSSTVTKGNYNATTGIWTIGSMLNGTSETLTITANVNLNGNHTNSASISGGELDGNIVNNISTIEPTPSDFFIPEGFSPNGDGINDLFVIRGLENYPNNSISIYNRWGNLVFSANPYTNNWDGKNTEGLSVGSDELPIGTYFYLLDLGNDTDIIKGTIYLNR